MAKKKNKKKRLLFNFIIEKPMADGLTAIKDRDGISESEQVRRAIVEWLKVKGIHVERTPKAKRKR